MLLCYYCIPPKYKKLFLCCILVVFLLILLLASTCAYTLTHLEFTNVSEYNRHTNTIQNKLKITNPTIFPIKVVSINKEVINKRLSRNQSCFYILRKKDEEIKIKYRYFMLSLTIPIKPQK